MSPRPHTAVPAELPSGCLSLPPSLPRPPASAFAFPPAGGGAGGSPAAAGRCVTAPLPRNHVKEGGSFVLLLQRRGAARRGGRTAAGRCGAEDGGSGARRCAGCQRPTSLISWLEARSSACGLYVLRLVLMNLFVLTHFIWKQFCVIKNR